MRTRAIDVIQIERRDQDLFLIDGPATQQLALGIADKAPAPELDAAVRGTLVTDSIDAADKAAVGHRVRLLDQLPARLLRRPELGFFRWMPTDGGRI